MEFYQKKEAEELNSLYELLGLPLIPYAKNYEGSNKNEYISMVAYELINEEDPLQAIVYILNKE